jgi:hypothetical protein
MHVTQDPPPVAAEIAQCPDPHEDAPDLVSDLPLRQLGDELAAWLATDVAAGADEEITRARLRPFLDRLRELGCPPEYMLLHLKKLLIPSQPSDKVAREEPREFNARRDSVITMAIKEYFA